MEKTQIITDKISQMSADEEKEYIPKISVLIPACRQAGVVLICANLWS